MIAVAYVNHGRWVADCPRPYCGSACQLQPRQTQFWCGPTANGCCDLTCEIQWPGDADDIWEALGRRPVPGTRNWFPAGHPLAVRAGVEHGQTPADLLAENDMYGVK